MVRQYVADLLIGCRDVCRVPGWLADGLMVMASKGNKRRGKQMNVLSHVICVLYRMTRSVHTEQCPYLLLVFTVPGTLRAFLGV